MRTICVLILSTIVLSDVSAQILQFQDPGLKSLLINENTMSTDPFSLPDMKIDLNNDQEISMEEALAVDNLYLTDYNGQYEVLSLDDLSHFENLESLSIVLLGNSSETMVSFSGFTYDALTYFHISDCYPVDSIDVSSLPDVTTLEIMGFNGLSYLNVQNGSEANMSLFYTENIASACVDSIADEFNLVHSAMAPGTSPSLICDVTSITEYEDEPYITFYPNPTEGLLSWNSEAPIEQLSIHDNLGRLVGTYPGKYSEVDLSHLENGRYTIAVIASNRQTFIPIVKN